jgi:2-phospho-L-lactate/phosphoenolpyruvate guanylyltransferase
MKIAAVVAVKAAAEGKQRIAPVLDRSGRERLIKAMLSVVLGAIRGSRPLAAMYVLTPDSTLVPPDMVWIPDTGGGLNAELKRAAAIACARGAEAVLILPADLPWIVSADIDSLLQRAQPGRIIVAPDKAYAGTNALLGPSGLMDPSFGEQSLARHSRLAAYSGAFPVLHYCGNLARDIDEPGDLWELAEHPSGSFGFLNSYAMAAAQ